MEVFLALIELAQRQALPLEQKILLTSHRIREWYEHWNGQVYVSFSGGKYRTTGVSRTGCVFCCYGVHLEPTPNRFDRLKETHAQLHDYCMDKLGLKEVLDYVKGGLNNG